MPRTDTVRTDETPPDTTRTDTARWGLFEAPATPPELVLDIDPTWSPSRLSREITAAVLPFVATGSALLIVFNIAMMLVPVAIGRFVDEVIAPLTGGAELADVTGALVTWSLALGGLYLAMNLGYRFGGRIGWLGVQRAQYELSQAMLRRVLDPRGMGVGAARPARCCPS